jgi:DNA-binding MarR family transcriptional regulator
MVGMGEPRWLDAREQRAWRGFNDMRRQLDKEINHQLTRDARLSAADYELLVPLSEAPDQQLRARDLARAVDWERSRLSHQVRRMEERGLVERQECPTDARGAEIRLTAAGRRAIESAAPDHVATVRRHFIDLLTPEELDTLTAISGKVLGHLADAARTGDPAPETTTPT